MKEQPKLEEVIDLIRKMIDEKQNSLFRLVHVGTLTDILYLLQEQKTSGAWEFISHNPSYSPFDDSPASLYECTNCGYTTGSKTKYCPVCGYTDSYQTFIEPLGHNFVDGKCTRCGKKENE